MDYTNGKINPPTTARDAFRWCLLHGFNALPGRFKTKATLEEGDGIYQQRASADRLDEWFPADQKRNIGVVNGEMSDNLLDIDLDSREAVLAAPLLLPPSAWRFRRRGAPDSAHRLYRTDVPFPEPQRKFRDLQKGTLLELRGTGHWSIWPPSMHPSGAALEWESVDDAGPPRLPLVEMERAAGRLAAASLVGRYWPTKGSRHEASLALAGALLRAGWPQDDVERFVEAVAVAARDEEARGRLRNVASTVGKIEDGKNATGWPSLAKCLGQEGEAVVRQVREWLGMKPHGPCKAALGGPPAKRVRSLASFRPFPVDALPPILGEMVTATARAIGCDESLAVVPALCVDAGCIGNARAILLKRGWIEPAVLWGVTVNDSGGHKTPAYSAVVEPLTSIQMDRFDAHREQCEEYRCALADWQERPKDERGAKPEEPDEPDTFLTSDATIEALGVLLEQRPKGLLVARDELDAWFASFARYRGKGGGSDRPQWLELHRAGTLLTNRLTREKKRMAVRRAAVSLTGTIQPAVLARALDEEAMQSGLAARFLMAMPPRRKRVWTEEELPEELVVRYQDLLRALLALPLDDEAKRKPHILGLSGPAKKLWIDFYNEWADEQFNAEGEQAACFAKIEAYAPRLMLVHHVVTHVGAGVDDRQPITETSARAGIEMARWFAAEAVRIYGALSESKEERDARRLVEFIQGRGGAITSRELQRANNRKYPASEHAEAALENLVQVGMGGWDERSAGAKGGRPSRHFVLCMTHDKTDDPPEDDDGGDGAPHDETPDGTSVSPDGPTVFQAEDKVSSVLSCVMHNGLQTESPCEVLGGVSSCGEEVLSAGERFLLVKKPADLGMILAALDNTALVGVDVETTGLDPRCSRVRLLALATDTIDGGTFTYLVDCFAVDPAPLWEVLAGKALVLHNAIFDLAFLARLGFTPGAVVLDSMLTSRVLYAGAREKHGLADCVRRELGEELAKDMQRADWSGTLAVDHLTYAARDVEVLRPLHAALSAKIAAATLADTVRLEERCLPALVWMANAGVAVSRENWSALAANAKQDAAQLREQMAALAPTTPGEMFVSWNWDSPQDMKRLFAALGVPLESTGDEALAGVNHPLAGLLRSYREATKRLGTYGESWLKNIAADGRVYAHWNQLGAEATGRMSCSEPNMQQIPRDPAYRRCVQAPAGRVLVKADYSQIELRIAAKITQDAAMMEAYRTGEDLHTRTARQVLRLTQVTKKDRQLAKAINFGLLYGMGPRGFQMYAKSQYGLDLTEGQAKAYRAAFFRAYPGLEAWHRRVKGNRTPETRTLAGRRRLIPSADPGKPEEDRRKFEAAMDRERLNTPVQGTGADGLKLALALLCDRRDQMPGAFPVLAVHDEVVVEANADQADAAAAWVKAAMVDAMAPLIDPVPVEIEVKVGRTWAGD